MNILYTIAITVVRVRNGRCFTSIKRKKETRKNIEGAEKNRRKTPVSFDDPESFFVRMAKYSHSTDPPIKSSLRAPVNGPQSFRAIN